MNLLLTPTLQMLEETTNSSDLKSVELKQFNLCSLLQVILTKVGHLIQEPLVPNIITVIIAMFKQAGKVTENGLLALNGLAKGRSG